MTLEETSMYEAYKFTSHSVISADEAQAFDELMHHLVNVRAGTLFDTEEGSRRRKRVIEKLSVMVRDWATEIGRAKQVSAEEVENGGGIHIQIFGSTKLDVHNIDSDIDMLCIAPSFVTREDFFSSFCEKLCANADVDNLLSIPEAYTPVIKFSLDNQPVDMVFASLQFSPLPLSLDVLELRWLTGLDEQSVRSMNGVRVAQWIGKLVPDMESFKVALRVVKYWAKQRGLYSSILGFLGGVNYAILVALVCQSFENCSPYWLVRKFFDMFTLWRWPTPVMLRKFEDLQFTHSDGRYLPVWNPLVNFKDSLHIMPIITPAYPAMNSAYNVSQPQFRCIMDEFVRAHVMFNQHPSVAGFPWETLLESSTREFFSKFPYYVQIDIKAKQAEDHRIWFGWVESRIRMLILALEQPPTVFSHPYANCFHRQPGTHAATRTPSENNAEYGPHEGGHIINFDAHSTAPAVQSYAEVLQNKPGNNSSSSTSSTSSSATTEEKAFTTPKKKIAPSLLRDNDWYTSSFFIGISFRKDLERIDISFPVQDFKHRVMQWNQRKEDMELDLKVITRDEIPEFVFTVDAEPSNIKSCTPKPQRRKAFRRPNLVLGVAYERRADADLEEEDEDDEDNDGSEEEEELENEGIQGIWKEQGEQIRQEDRHAEGQQTRCVLETAASSVTTSVEAEHLTEKHLEQAADNSALCSDEKSSRIQSQGSNAETAPSLTPPLSLRSAQSRSKSLDLSLAAAAPSSPQVIQPPPAVFSLAANITPSPPLLPRMPRPQHLDFHVQEHSSALMDSAARVQQRSCSFDDSLRPSSAARQAALHSFSVHSPRVPVVSQFLSPSSVLFANSGGGSPGSRTRSRNQGPGYRSFAHMPSIDPRRSAEEPRFETRPPPLRFGYDEEAERTPRERDTWRDVPAEGTFVAPTHLLRNDLIVQSSTDDVLRR